MGNIFTWFDFLDESQADLEACFDNLSEDHEPQAWQSPSADSLNRILKFVEVYETLEVKSFGVAEIYKN
ncbi:hypothetical protein C8N47_11312 [Mangrovibacterium marinum]|uniref:Uncharacterized protein n=1 Tax=Mangrovibacterium marinum TaxID=1639118 RepID=A0A2T5BZN0_9BACT|nr:hypothetical protein [Mangrovibacterium marinum]PTN07747.1 hypothetical protein C8N47_11312 [Mangrovibacterium marinum]